MTGLAKINETRGSAAMTAAPASPSVQMIHQLVEAASRPETDIEKMERLFAMAEKMQRSQSEAEYQAAMAAAKLEIVPVLARQTNTHTGSQYADLAGIAAAIDPIIAAHGFSMDFDEEPCEVAGNIRVVADIMHSAGHSKRKGITVALDKSGSAGRVNKTDIQAKGSTITYARRYLKLMAFDVAITDDDGAATPPAPTITGEQIDELRHALTIEEIDEATFCQVCRIDGLASITAANFKDALDRIRREGDRQRKRRAAAEADQ